MRHRVSTSLPQVVAVNLCICVYEIVSMYYHDVGRRLLLCDYYLDIKTPKPVMLLRILSSPARVEPEHT